ncbi:MAG: fibronectin type III-like domain-contianing protein, partial [Anaerolineales bacterium]|nr:fibronectin type III-like domain-contianing protein [Anaerolineales bacterium]
KSHWYGDYVSGEPSPLFPFGHGLSYTSFAYDNLRIAPESAAAGEVIEISCEITNTGDVHGEEVAQLYIRDVFASSPRPIKVLAGYQRLSLEPAEKRQMTFQMQVNQCAFYDRDLNLVLEPGTIQVMVGSSSEDIRLNGEFEITGDLKVKVNQRVLHCPVRLD